MKIRLLLFCILGFCSFPCLANSDGELTILHTNDLHSHFEGSGPDFYFNPKTNDGDPVKGHYARLSFKINEIRDANKTQKIPTLVFDSGDFFSGTLFHSLSPSRGTSFVPEFSFFAEAQYDAFTFGNHEFDAGELGLEIMLQKADKHHLLSNLVLSNLRQSENESLLSQLIKKQKQYKVIEVLVNNHIVRVGVLGLVGTDAAKVSAVNRKNIQFYGFNDIASRGEENVLYEQVSKLVAKIRTEAKADIVIALFHGGNNEDEALAKNVKGLNVIVSGHTHQAYMTPKIIENTLIVQAGSYGSYLGQLNLRLQWEDSDKNNPVHVTLKSSRLHTLDDSVPVDQKILKRITAYKKEIAKIFKNEFRYDQKVTTFKENKPKTREPNDSLGQWLTTSIRYQLNSHLTEDPLDLYMTSMGLVRNGITLVENQPTTYQFSDIFRILSIGFDKRSEPRPGSPIVHFYITKDEFLKLMNFLEVYRFISSNFTAAYSDSVSYSIRDWGVPFLNRIRDLKINGLAFDETKPLLHVATSEYVANFLPIIKNLSKGFVVLNYRNKDGQIIEKPLFLEVPSEPMLLSEFLMSKETLQNGKN